MDKDLNKGNVSDVYSVQKGDTLWGIAKKTGVPFQDLISYNRDIGDINKIQIGQEIKLSEPSVELEDVDYKQLRDYERDLNASGDNESIIKSVRHDRNYVVIDKKNKKLKVYDKDNNLIHESSKIGTGSSRDDYNTITYVNDKGDLIDKKGNNSTPAGITMISGIGSYHGKPSFIRSRYNPKTGKWDDNLASSMHYGASDGSNGCVRLIGDEAEELARHVGANTPVYTLPERDGSRFVVRDGKLSFVADNPYGDTEGDKKYWDDYNTYLDRTYTPLGIDIVNSDIEPEMNKASIVGSIKWLADKFVPGGNYEENVEGFIDGITSSKEAIMRDFGIDSYTYNNLAELALGIAGQESKFGTSTRYAYKNMLSDEQVDLVKGAINMIKGKKDNKISHRSRGITQIKLKGDNKDLRGMYEKYAIDEDALDNPVNSAVGTMIRLAHIYKNEVAGKKFEGVSGEISPMDAVLYKWSGRNKLLQSKKADPDKDEYLGNVWSYAGNFGMTTKVPVSSNGENMDSEDMKVNKDEAMPDFNLNSSELIFPRDEVRGYVDNLLNIGSGMILPGVNKFADGGVVDDPDGDDWTSEDIGNPVYSKQSHRAVDQKTRDERFMNELAQSKTDNFENVIVPLAESAIDFTPIVGDLKSAWDALLYTKEGNHAMAALAAMGIFPGIPGISGAKKIFSKKGERLVRSLHKNTIEPIDFEDLAHIDKRLKKMVDTFTTEGGMNQKRKFSEMFPILPWDIIKANKVGGDAVREGVNYVEDYYKNPTVKAKIQKILGENGYNMPEDRRAILKEAGVIDKNGHVDVDKYIDMFPHEVGELSPSLEKEIEGYHNLLEDGGETVTSDRSLFYMRDPRRVAATAAHEQNHVMQEVMGFDNMSIRDYANNYYKANPDHTIGKMFQEVANKKVPHPWFNSPNELHSTLMEFKKVKGIAPDAVIDDRLLDRILDIGVLNQFFDVTEANKPKIKKLLNALPAAVPVAGAAAVGRAMTSDKESYAAGGEVGPSDNYDIAFDYLTNERKLKPEHAIAIIANLKGESNLDPDVENSIGAYGIQQWLGPRKKELFKKYGEKPTLKQQLEFLVDEHEGKVKGAGWNYLNKGNNMGTDRFNYYMYSRSDFDNAPSVADAIIAWNQGFGRPATHELNNEYRLKAGLELASRYGVDFGDPRYGQMGLTDGSNPEWMLINRETLQPASFRDIVTKKDEGPIPPLSNGVASYKPEKSAESKVSSTTSEVKEEGESAYAKRLREKAEQLSKKQREDAAKLRFFNEVWNGISLRKK